MHKPPDQVDEFHKTFYTDIAGKYHGLRYGGRYGGLFRQLHHEILDGLLPSGSTDRVLEIACGTGHTTELLQAKGIDYVACDLTPNMLEQARQRLGSSAPLARANALHLPFPTASFDIVLSTRFLHLFPMERQRLLLAEMLRVLKPGGRMVVDFDNFTSRWVLALPHLLYNLLRYRRMAPDTHYNRIPATEALLLELGLTQPTSIGVAGYHLVIAELLSHAFALRLGRYHRSKPWRILAEQFVTTGTKQA
jgi:ubiquinone/menaquinone biosynthesis C-methylase UbiE